MSGVSRGHLAMLVFSALVAGSFSLGSLAVNHIAPVALNAVRFVLAAAVMGTGHARVSCQIVRTAAGN